MIRRNYGVYEEKQEKKKAEYLRGERNDLQDKLKEVSNQNKKLIADANNGAASQ